MGFKEFQDIVIQPVIVHIDQIFIEIFVVPFPIKIRNVLF